MSIPDYESCMLPILKLCEDGKPHSLRELTTHVSDHFELSVEERKGTLPSGVSTVIYSRVGWAKTYLKKSGLLIQTGRGIVTISELGKEVLAEEPKSIGNKDLKRFDQFRDFVARSRPDKTAADSAPHATSSENNPDNQNTPEEALENAYLEVRSSLADEILDKVRECSSEFFERLVVDLLVAMGYGGSRKDAGQRIGGVGDEGIDGIINEDRLGLDVIYIQAKKWENPISRPEIQRFVGALQGKRARKGVFITTSRFTREARQYVNLVDVRVILIDGEQLAQYMVDFDLGVATQAVYEVKRIDTDYFENE